MNFIRVRCNQTINDDRWKDKKIIEGEETDLVKYDLDSLLKQYPGCVTEIKMTKEDWINLATKKALQCKDRIEKLKKRGIIFSSYYLGVITFERWIG